MALADWSTEQLQEHSQPSSGFVVSLQQDVSPLGEESKQQERTSVLQHSLLQHSLWSETSLVLAQQHGESVSKGNAIAKQAIAMHVNRTGLITGIVDAIGGEGQVRSRWHNT